MNRDQRLIMVAMEYLDEPAMVTLGYVATWDAELQTELLELLHEVVGLAELDEPITLTTEEQALISRVAARQPWKAMVEERCADLW